MVDAAFRQLLPMFQQVLELNRLGYTREQIADELGLSPGTVKSRISRGQAKMRELVGDLWGADETS